MSNTTEQPGTDPSAPLLPPGPPAPARGPRVSREQMLDVDRLRRSVSDRRIAGVCGGLGRQFDVDPLLVRIVMVVLALVGAGLVLYVGLWLMVPDEGQAQAPVPVDPKTRSIIITVLAILTAFSLLSDWSDSGWVIIPAGIIGLVFWAKESRHAPLQPAPPPPPYGAGPVTPADRQAAVGYGSPDPAGVAGYGYAPGPPAQQRRRRTGPVLFWSTCALLAIAFGSLALAESGGVSIALDVYFAIGLAIVGVMLLIGSVYGRAGGLIALGLVLALCLVSSVSLGQVDARQVHTPLTAAAVSTTYSTDAGDIVLDLRQVRDLQALDGRTITVRADVGRLQVTVPDNVGLDVVATISGPGQIDLPATDKTPATRLGGPAEVSQKAVYPARKDAPSITLHLALDFGQISLVRSPA